MYKFIKDKMAKEVIVYIICLIPLYLYGIYKNGYLLYVKDLIPFVSIFKVIILLLLGFLAYLLSCKIFKKNIISNDLLGVFIIPLFMPVSINLLLYFIMFLVGILFSNLISKFININKLVIILLMILGISYLTSDVNFLNKAEELNMYHFNIWDILWGRGIGGIASTSIILGIIIMTILSIFNSYKSSIVASSFLGVLLLSIILNNYDYLLNSTLIMGLIFILSDNKSSPYSNIPMIIYGFVAGALSTLMIYFGLTYIGVFVGILIINILYVVGFKIADMCL